MGECTGELNENYLDYNRAINKLIPLAVKEANALFPDKLVHEMRPGKDGEPFKWYFWTEAYHNAMRRLGRERGIWKLNFVLNDK